MKAGDEPLHYVTFKSLHEQPLVALRRACACRQDGKHKHPAVILLHGSAGPSLREGGYADVLNEAGLRDAGTRSVVGARPGRRRVGPAAHSGRDLARSLRRARLSCRCIPPSMRRGIGVGGFSFGGVATHAGGDAQAQRQLPRRRSFPRLHAGLSRDLDLQPRAGFRVRRSRRCADAADHRRVGSVRQRSRNLRQAGCRA